MLVWVWCQRLWGGRLRALCTRVANCARHYLICKSLYKGAGIAQLVNRICKALGGGAVVSIANYVPYRLVHRGLYKGAGMAHLVNRIYKGVGSLAL